MLRGWWIQPQMAISKRLSKSTQKPQVPFSAFHVLLSLFLRAINNIALPEFMKRDEGKLIDCYENIAVTYLLYLFIKTIWPEAKTKLFSRTRKNKGQISSPPLRWPLHFPPQLQLKQNDADELWDLVHSFMLQKAERKRVICIPKGTVLIIVLW